MHISVDEYLFVYYICIILSEMIMNKNEKKKHEKILGESLKKENMNC